MGYLEDRRMWSQFGKPKVEKKKYTIPKKSAKKIAEEKDEREEGTDTATDRWFEERRKEMRGRCELCGGKSEKHNDKYYRHSIHHILEKRPTMFPSVALNENNWLEVCFFGNSCHTNIHNGTISWELLHDSAEWKIIVDKFKKIFPFIVEAERKNIHPLLLKEIK